jgi:F0F1-type ATP synthase assembly protein I
MMNDSLKERIASAQAKHAQQNPVQSQPASGREMSQGVRAFMEMFGVLLGSGLMGYWLDRFFETAPTFLIIFIILGIISAVFNLYKLSKNLGTAIGSNSLQSEEKVARKPTHNESK